MSKKKIPLPEKSFCGLTFKTNNWWNHFLKCEFCKSKYSEYSKLKEEEKNKNWNKKCECGCGQITKYGNKRIFGHNSIGSHKTEEQKQRYRDSFTQKRRDDLSKRFKINNPMFSLKVREKLRKTCLEKYGVENAAYSDVVKNKISKNNSMHHKKYRDKIQSVKLKKYGNSNYNNIKKYKETCLKKYGVDNVQKIREIKQKSVDTYTKNLASGKYKIPNNWKTGYYVRKNGKKEWYDSSYELKRMQYYDDNNIEWTKKHKIRIPYTNKDGLNTYYVPDFFINNNTIEEVKGWLKESDKIKACEAIQYCKNNNFEYKFLLGANFNIISELSYVKA